MPKDIRKLLDNYPEESGNMSLNHSKKFEKKLMKELHDNKSSNSRKIVYWLSIAASLTLLVTIGIQFIDKGKVDPDPDAKNVINVKQEISLGNISPELNTIETYYTNSINLELSELEITEENKEILNSYLDKIKELTDEYKTLTKELNTKGVNDQTIDALISNLQLRLQLLKRLKKQLKDLKEINSKQNEIT